MAGIIPGWIFSVGFFLLAITVSDSQKASLMTFKENGYENLVIAIHPNVTENDKILVELKSMCTIASSYLYNVTRKRAFFRNITILIPDTWTDKPEYQDATREFFVLSDVRVDSANPMYGNNPYAQQPGLCGEPGQYIHLTPDFVTNNNVHRKRNWGDPGRVLAHEFAHLRYGVFDEYGMPESKEYPYFYLDDKKRIQLNACTTDIKGRRRNRKTFGKCKRDRKTRLPDDNCVFVPKLKNVDTKASVMAFQFIHSVHSFCEAKPSDPQNKHNPDAPNQHNKMCGGRGSWDVIMENADFDGRNPPRDVPSTTPTFRLVYPRMKIGTDGVALCGRRFVLVLDVSTSMEKNNRFFKQAQAADKFIRDIIPTGCEVGIVVFARKANTSLAMTPIRSDADRTLVSNAVPKSRDDLRGFTAIGDGVLRARSILKAGGRDPTGDQILLITDGVENSGRRVSRVIKDVIASGITVHTLAYSAKAASALRILSTRTKGKYFYFSEGDNSTSLDSFIASILSDGSRCHQDDVVELDRQNVFLTTGQEDIAGAVLIDKTVGKDTIFVFTLPSDSDIGVTLTDPNGRTITAADPEFSTDKALGIQRVLIPDATAGNWTYYLHSNTVGRKIVGQEIVTLTTRSRARDSKNAIVVNAWMNKMDVSLKGKPSRSIVYAHVTKGYAPIIKADVTAFVETPSGKAVMMLPLRDDGILPDSVADDGMYSAYFTNFTENGRYSVDAKITGHEGRTAVRQGGDAGGKAYAIYQNVSSPLVVQETGSFQRSASAGAFDVVGYDGSDVYPPNPVTDLRVLTSSYENSTVTLRWTSPGDDFDDGIVTRYDLRYASNTSTLRQQFYSTQTVMAADITEGSLQPMVAGTKHHVTIRVTTEEDSAVVFALISYDDADHRSDLSNIVAATIDPVEPDDLPNATVTTEQTKRQDFSNVVTVTTEQAKRQNFSNVVAVTTEQAKRRNFSNVAAVTTEQAKRHDFSSVAAVTTKQAKRRDFSNVAAVTTEQAKRHDFSSVAAVTTIQAKRHDFSSVAAVTTKQAKRRNFSNVAAVTTEQAKRHDFSSVAAITTKQAKRQDFPNVVDVTTDSVKYKDSPNGVASTTDQVEPDDLPNIVAGTTKHAEGQDFSKVDATTKDPLLHKGSVRASSVMNFPLLTVVIFGIVLTTLLK